VVVVDVSVEVLLVEVSVEVVVLVEVSVEVVVLVDVSVEVVVVVGFVKLVVLNVFWSLLVDGMVLFVDARSIIVELLID
jgi:hypothetical protein